MAAVKMDRFVCKTLRQPPNEFIIENTVPQSCICRIEFDIDI
jgi:hypothetical protein